MPVNILLLSGSTRTASTNTATLRTAAAICPPDISAVLYEGLAALPAFDPDADVDNPHPEVAHLRRAFAEADAVLICTPEYAGTLPGSLKNLLDWTVGTGELNHKCVAWLTVAAPGRGEGAAATLRTVLGYVIADIVEPACARVPVPRQAVGVDGLVTDLAIRESIVHVLEELARHVRTASTSHQP
ncbi:MAG TPA: NADPH-dependent FMN reductase [Jiangellales bacterium]|nr:NADPH-dependent FMN reductase [Jiangellales bacterium]